MKFEDIGFTAMNERFANDEVSEPVQAYVELDNGFWLSVVKHRFSYGGEKGLYEIGVMLGNQDGPQGMVTPKGWTDEVKGHLTEANVMETIKELAAHDPDTAEQGEEFLGLLQRAAKGGVPVDSKDESEN